MSKHNSLSFLYLVIAAAFLVTPVRTVHAVWYLDSTGTLLQVEPSVLGDEAATENESELETETEKEATMPAKDSEAKTSLTKVQEQQRELAKKKLENEIEARKKLLETQKDKVVNKIENKGRKLEVIKETRDAKGELKKTETSELPPKETLRVALPGENEVTVNAVGTDEMEVVGQKVRTRTHFPITIGENNALIITKKDGTQKTVAFLPDEAVAKLQQKGFTAVGENTELQETADGQVVYKVPVKKEKKILGLFRAEFQSDTSISADTGEVVDSQSTETSPLKRFLEKFAL